MLKPTLNDIYSVMTRKQARRCEMRWERRFSVKLIAEMEGVSIWAVYKSIGGGVKKAKNFYEKFPERYKKGTKVP